MATQGAAATEEEQQAQSEIMQRQAALDRDTAILAAARAQSNVLQSHIEEAKANVAHGQAVLDLAKLNLSYTRIYATAASRTVQLGDFVQPGETLFYAVPNRICVIANFKEN